MATGQDVINLAASKLNQRVTVPTNPFGGQCAAFVDWISQHIAGKDLAYCNAIELLDLAHARGLKVTRFTGSEVPPIGAIFVSAARNHEFGHTGVVEEVDATGTYFTTLEQNVDLNADALYNGGWVRRKVRVLYADGTFTYSASDGLPAQTMIGWFTIADDVPQAKKEEVIEEGEDTMQLLFNVKGDKNFGESATYYFNGYTNQVRLLTHPDEIVILDDIYAANNNGRKMPRRSWTNAAPWHKRLISATGAGSTDKKLDEILKSQAELSKAMADNIK